MDIPTREEAIATLGEGQAGLDSLFARLSDEELTRAATIGGGEWSAKDLMGHVAFWEELAIETLECWRAGRRPSVDDISDAGDAGVDAANARNQERTAGQSLEEVRTRADTAHARIVEAIRAMSDQDWTAEPAHATTRRVPLAERLGRILGGADRGFAHAFDHLPDLEAYTESLGRR